MPYRIRITKTTSRVYDVLAGSESEAKDKAARFHAFLENGAQGAMPGDVEVVDYSTGLMDVELLRVL